MMNNCKLCGHRLVDGPSSGQGNPHASRVVDGLCRRISDIREAFAEYVRAEGCSCCRDMEAHIAAADRLGELLGFERYADGGGYDFYEGRFDD